MSEEYKELRNISNKLSFLIRVLLNQKEVSQLKIEQLLEEVRKMGLSDIDLSTMFGVTVQSIWNARSRKRKKVKKKNGK